MVKFSDVVETTGSERLDYGKHLVKISQARNTTKDGDLLLDENGIEQWALTFENAEGAKHYEYFRFSGKMANKTGYMLRAVGLLDPDEKISETKKEFSHEDVEGCYLYITIVENPTAKEEKWKKTIKYDGFEKYEKAVAKKTATKKTETKEEKVVYEDGIPF